MHKGKGHYSEYGTGSLNLPIFLHALTEQVILQIFADILGTRQMGNRGRSEGETKAVY